MKQFFHDPSTYNPSVDPVATVALEVECNPGQSDTVMAFLHGVSKQAGVYGARIECHVYTPSKVEAIEEAAPAVIEDTHSEAVAIAEAHADAEAAPVVPLAAAPKSKKAKSKAKGRR